MTCKMCDRELRTLADQHRGYCPRCWKDELRQTRLFEDPPVVEGQQTLLLEEGSAIGALGV